MVTRALVHDFFVAEGGAEQCAIELANLMPDAPVFTSFFDADRFGDRIAPERIRSWALSRLTPAPSHFRALFPLYAGYFASLKVDADIVVSSSIAFTKAVRTRRDAFHVSYVYTPMRYAWDLDTYLAGSSYSFAVRAAARAIRPAMRAWDRSTAQRPDSLIAISHTVRRRIEKLWHRAVDDVIYPPVPVHEIDLSDRDEGFYLVAARLLAYRRIDLVVQACTRLHRPLVVVGDGPERAKLERLAGHSVTFRGHVSRQELLRLMRNCHAYVVPGVEDFGIAPVEAMAAGKPVIAYRGGGVTETVVEGTTGLFFASHSVESLSAALIEREQVKFDPHTIRRQATLFAAPAFRSRWLKAVPGAAGSEASS